MGWRSIVISNPAKLSVKNNQLIIFQEEEAALPLEDISVVLIENQQVNITSKLLSDMSDFNVLLFICNNKHIPNAVFTPFYQHSRQLKIIKMQLQLSKNFLDECWQQIIKKRL